MLMQMLYTILLQSPVQYGKGVICATSKGIAMPANYPGHVFRSEEHKHNNQRPWYIPHRA
jgi:hypothetical protein